ncbi:MAG: hypothetical protein NPIRA06_14930 [Nitrospirales bacterium]|nr:MAG: hypothetical protein NPIRA06_14930 [Nitrospirales bacterium]
MKNLPIQTIKCALKDGTYTVYARILLTFHATLSAIVATSAKEARRRQGPPLAGFFQQPLNVSGSTGEGAVWR